MSRTRRAAPVPSSSPIGSICHRPYLVVFFSATLASVHNRVGAVPEPPRFNLPVHPPHDLPIYRRGDLHFGQKESPPLMISLTRHSDKHTFIFHNPTIKMSYNWGELIIKMDGKDHKIIAALREDAGAPIRKISKHLCLGKVILLHAHTFKY